jgi:hypothetical protein
MIENEGYQHCQHFRCIKEHRATEFTWFESKPIPFKTQKNIRLNLQPMHTSISFRKMYGAQSVVCMGL